MTPFGGPFWVSRCQEVEKMKKQGKKKTKKQRKTKYQDMKSTQLLGGCLFGAIFTLKLGIFFLSFGPSAPIRTG